MYRILKRVISDEWQEYYLDYFSLSYSIIKYIYYETYINIFKDQWNFAVYKYRVYNRQQVFNLPVNNGVKFLSALFHGLNINNPGRLT